jgi:uroporphyrinogen decarboxylase
VPQYAEFGRPYDLQVLEAIRSMSDFVVLHIHGMNVFFSELLDYPVDAINWHDRRTIPSLTEARGMTAKCLMGGISELGVLMTGSLDEVRAEVTEALESVARRGVIVGPGCVVPPDCAEERYRAVTSAARGPRG